MSLPPRTQRWDFENKCPADDAKRSTIDAGQVRLGDIVEENVGWREMSPKQKLCGLWGHHRENNHCVLCGAIREE